jgi:hypothetical protein
MKRNTNTIDINATTSPQKKRSTYRIPLTLSKKLLH